MLAVYIGSYGTTGQTHQQIGADFERINVSDQWLWQFLKDKRLVFPDSLKYLN